jgi:hypothetical protein
MKDLKVEKINAMKRITFLFTLLALLSVFSSCSKGYGCFYSSNELEPLEFKDQQSNNSFAKNLECQDLIGEEQILAD